MVLRGKTRGNGDQLAGYLTRVAGNDNICVFDIRGTSQPDDIRSSLLEMSLTSELTKSHKGLYHAQINPAYGEDRRMQPDDWFKAADILENELKFNNQKRVIVLHEKKGRTHAHIVWERYNHATGTMISDSFSRLAQDRARKTIEIELEQKPTPYRNSKRPEMKGVLTDLWQKTVTGAEFIKASVQKGYFIAKGELRRPLMVVDETGRSFDLVRQLSGIKSKEVRERLKDEKLESEKDVITTIRAQIKKDVGDESSKSIAETQAPGHWVNRYEELQALALQHYKESEKDRIRKELKEQLEQHRQTERER